MLGLVVGFTLLVLAIFAGVALLVRFLTSRIA